MTTHGAPKGRGAAAGRLVASEEELLVRVAIGDTAAFAELYDRLVGAVYGLCRAILGGPGCADDAAHGALLELWRAAPQYDPARASVRSWALTVAHRRAVDQLRSLRGARDDTPSFALVTDTSPTGAENQRRNAQLAVLTTCQRDAITLVYYQGHTDGDAATLLGIAVDTLQARLRDGLHRLRDEGATSRSDGAQTTAGSVR